MPRHIFTPEERARGHKLTREDRQRGGRNVPKAKRAKAALANPTHLAKLVEMGKRYRLTSERAKELARLSASVRRERRAAALLRLELGKPSPVDGQPARRGSESREPRQGEPDDVAIIDGQMMVGEIKSASDAYALGASLASKLFVGGSIDAPPMVVEAPSVDPFTLSALKRFRLGPMSPFQLTRSQRAHVDIMREQGYLTVTGDSMLALTEKGREAINATPDE